jgi:hypothetical protein
MGIALQAMRGFYQLLRSYYEIILGVRIARLDMRQIQQSVIQANYTEKELVLLLERNIVGQQL